MKQEVQEAQQFARKALLLYLDDLTGTNFNALCQALEKVDKKLIESQQFHNGIYLTESQLFDIQFRIDHYPLTDEGKLKIQAIYIKHMNDEITEPQGKIVNAIYQLEIQAIDLKKRGHGEASIKAKEYVKKHQENFGKFLRKNITKDDYIKSSKTLTNEAKKSNLSQHRAAITAVNTIWDRIKNLTHALYCFFAPTKTIQCIKEIERKIASAPKCN